MERLTLSRGHGERGQSAAAHDLQDNAVHPAGNAREGQANAAAKELHRGRDPSCEPHQVRAPRRRHVFRRARESWCDQRKCSLRMSQSWKLRPNHGSIIKQGPSILVLDDFKCHRDKTFIADLKKRANTTVIFIPGRLTPLLQPLDRMLNKQMKRLMRGKYSAYTASAPTDPKTGKLKPPGRGAVSTWCKEAWTDISKKTGKTCFKICGLTLALDGSEDHACCIHNFGEDYRNLLQQQHAKWGDEHPDVRLPPLELPAVPAASGDNPIMAAEKDLEGRLLPPGADEDSDSDVELVEIDSDVELVDGPWYGGAEEEIEL